MRLHQRSPAEAHARTFRPRKAAVYTQLKQHIDATIGSGNLREAVSSSTRSALPCASCPLLVLTCFAVSAGAAAAWRGLERVVRNALSLAQACDGRRGASPAHNCRSRLAVNTVDFFNAISMLYGMITESCTAQSCPSMCAGPKYEYRWADGVKARSPFHQLLGAMLTHPTAQVKKPIECTAPEYVLYLMEWIESQLDDETVRAGNVQETRTPCNCLTGPPTAQIFPQRPEQPFPRMFVDAVRTIFKRLFRVYAHIYHSHWDVMVSLGAEAHLNTCFKHFMYFTHAFSLIDKKELAPLAGAFRTCGDTLCSWSWLD